MTSLDFLIVAAFIAYAVASGLRNRRAAPRNLDSTPSALLLVAGLATTAALAAALSVFCLLVGIGSWLADSPAPGWFPFEAVWRGMLITGGVALVPLWYRLGYRDSGVGVRS